MFVLDARGKSVLIISDTHIPYSHRDYISFLTAIKRKLKPDIILSVGDELDFHGIHFHPTEAELFSAGHELDKAIDELQEGLHKLFPKMFLVESNHGSMVLRRLKHQGIPIRVLKEMKDLYGTPQWSWHENILLKTKIGDVFVTHGQAGGLGTLAKRLGCSVIQGHFHGNLGVTWHKSIMKEIFSMFVGCLVDYDSLSMRYGRNFVEKPILGVGWLGKDGTPKTIKMNVDKRNRWTKKLSI